jgi:hypothetical protein
MNHALTTISLIAESHDFFERIGHAMRSAGGRVDLSSLSIFLLIPVILGIICALRILYKRLFKHNYEAPTLLFMQLCSAHGLTRRERRTIRRAATRWQIDDPCLLFIDQKLWKFDESVRQIAPGNLKRKDVETFNLLSLYSRLMREEEVEQA